MRPHHLFSFLLLLLFLLLIIIIICFCKKDSVKKETKREEKKYYIKKYDNVRKDKIEIFDCEKKYYDNEFEISACGLYLKIFTLDDEIPMKFIIPKLTNINIASQKCYIESETSLDYINLNIVGNEYNFCDTTRKITGPVKIHIVLTLEDKNECPTNTFTDTSNDASNNVSTDTLSFSSCSIKSDWSPAEEETDPLDYDPGFGDVNLISRPAGINDFVLGQSIRYDNPEIKPEKIIRHMLPHPDTNNQNISLETEDLNLKDKNSENNLEHENSEDKPNAKNPEDEDLKDKDSEDKESEDKNNTKNSEKEDSDNSIYDFTNYFKE